jgi:hypothetical protein
MRNLMRKVLASLFLLASVLMLSLYSACSSETILYAQTLPYTATATWTIGDPATTSYNCYLDGVLVVTGTTLATTCSFPVATLGAHVAGVSTVVSTSIPPESTITTVSFTLKQPAAPIAPKVK